MWCWELEPHLQGFSRQALGTCFPETRLLRKGLGLLAVQQLAVSGYGHLAWPASWAQLLTPGAGLRSAWAPFLLFMQSPVRSFCVSSPGTYWATGSSYSTLNSTGDNSGSAGWGLMQALLHTGPPLQCSPGSKTIRTLLKHFYFTPPVGLPCVQDWVEPEKRASL